ncbi:priB protein, variant 2 [Coprinopsis cinerea AmutBmut pab1-1]|nr:priB protein, variant 2 [Coprinopsis cinerea AmutBmut pab1-1]
MIGMQASLDRILSAVAPHAVPPQPLPGHPPAPYPPPAMEAPPNPPGVPGQPPRNGFEMPAPPIDRARGFPPLPGFAPPPHKYASYGIIPSTAASSEDESEDTLPRSTINAPIEALQGLANAAAEAAAAPSAISPRVKKRKRAAEPTPRNAFPHVVEKGLVSEQEARELFNIFFAGCNLFIPLFDPAYDTYESLSERSPWTFDAILAIAAKIRSGNGPLSDTFYKCLEEAQGIARSSLFGPVVRKEAVQGMLLLAAWSTNGWLPSGHAMRMALDLGLHRALDKLADDSGKQRSEEEERNLVVSARIWLCLYWFDHQMSLGTGRPVVLRDESSIRHCRLLLSHPMASPTDVRLIALVEMVAQKTQIYETLGPLDGQVNHNTLSFIRRANVALDKWWTEHDELHRKTMDQESLLRKLLAGDLHYAKLWLVCLALRGASWDKMPFEQRELAFQAKEAASNCLAIFLTSAEYRASLRYAVHDSLVTAAFSGLFLLKMASLFPREIDLAATTTQVEQMAQLLSDVAAERYAFTLRIMLANLRRKVGMQTGVHLSNPLPVMPPPSFATTMVVPPQTYPADPSMPPPFTMEELGFAWPQEGVTFNSAVIPPWLQEQSLTDLGLPANGSEGIFLQTKGTNGWTGDFNPMPEAW